MLRKIFANLKKKKDEKELKKGLHKDKGDDSTTSNVNDATNTLTVLNVSMALSGDMPTEEEHDSKPASIGYKYAFKGDDSKHDSSGSSDYSSSYSSGYDSSSSSSSSDSNSYSSSSSYDSGSSSSFDSGSF